MNTEDFYINWFPYKASRIIPDDENDKLLEDPIPVLHVDKSFVKDLTQGRKDDQGKVRMELLPPELMTAVATILTSGAVKYDARNWEKGMNWSRVYGALLRHLNAWWDPYQSDTDEETGKSHLWHAGCCLAFLIAYEEREMKQWDDRPTKQEV